MSKKVLGYLALVIVVVGGGAFAYYRFRGEPPLPPMPPGFIEIAQAQLPLDSYAKIPKGFPAEMILGTMGEVLDGQTTYLGDATIMQIYVSTSDKADFLKGEYEKYFKAFDYVFSTTQRNEVVSEVKATKDKEEITVGIVTRDNGSLVRLKYQYTFANQ